MYYSRTGRDTPTNLFNNLHPHFRSVVLRGTPCRAEELPDNVTFAVYPYPNAPGVTGFSEFYSPGCGISSINKYNQQAIRGILDGLSSRWALQGAWHDLRKPFFPSNLFLLIPQIQKAGSR